MRNFEIEIDAKEFRDKLDIKDGRDGKDGKNGKDGSQGLKGDKGDKGNDGKNGLDGSSDTAEQLAEKMNTLRNALDFRVLTNIPDFVLSKDLGRGDQGGGGGSIVRYQDSTGATISQYVTTLQFGTGISTAYSGGVITLTATTGAGSPLTTKGDLYTYSTTNTRLGVGSNGQALLADSTAATGLKWTSLVTGVSSVTAADTTLTISPNTGAVVAGINLANPNTWTGVVTWSPTFRTSGSASYFTINSPADTGITASTESRGVNITGSTRTWADGTVASQSEYYFGAPTYNKTTTAATFTNLSTVTISGAPTAGAGVTMTHPWALWVQGGNSHFGSQIGYTQSTVGGTGAEFNDTNNTTGGQIVSVQNTSNGTSAYSGFNIGNNLSVDGGATTHYFGIFFNSSTYTDTTFGTSNAIASLGVMQNTDGPISIIAQASNAYTNFVVGGASTTNEVARYTTTQHLMAVQTAWTTSLGAINHLLGPIDQTFALRAGTPVSTSVAVAGNGISIIATNAVSFLGSTTSAAGGAITITAGNGAGITSGTANGGDVTITAGSTGGTSNNSIVGGGMTLTTGNTSGSGAGAVAGDMLLKTGNGSSGTSSRAGNWTVTIGSPGSQQSTNTNAVGSIIMTSGNARSLTANSGTGNTGGSISFTAGTGGGETGTGGTGGVGGAVSFLTGAGGTASGVSGTRTGGASGQMIIGTGAGGVGTTSNGAGGSLLLQTNATTRLTFTDSLATFSGSVSISGNLTTINSGTVTLGGVTVNIGGNTTTTTVSINNGASVSGATSTVNINGGAAASGSTKATNIANGALAGSTNTITVGALAATTTIALNGVTTFGTSAVFAASTTSIASLNIPSGTAPTGGNIVNGDVWYDGSHIQGRVNGTTVQLDNATTATVTSTVTATGQSADIGSTNLTTTGAGLYRLAYYLVDSVADLTAGTVRLNVTYTDAGASQTQQSATVALTILGTFTQGEIIIQLASGNIAYSTTHTGIFGTATYNLYMTLERLN